MRRAGARCGLGCEHIDEHRSRVARHLRTRRAARPRRPARGARARVVSRRHTGELNYDEYASFYNTDRTRVRAYLITPVPGEHESRDTTSTTAPVPSFDFYAIRTIRRAIRRGRST